MHCPTRHQIMMMSGQFHFPVALLPVPILCDAMWALVRSRSNGGRIDSALSKIVTRFHQDLCLLSYPGLTYREPVFKI
jgi:hypothetical protein